MTLADEAPPSDLTVFYDPLSYAAFDHPYEVYRQLRERAPVYYNDRRDLYVVSRYEDVKACLRNHEQMINALGNDMDGTHDSYGAGNLVAQDQPNHTLLRNGTSSYETDWLPRNSSLLLPSCVKSTVPTPLSSSLSDRRSTVCTTPPVRSPRH